MNVEEVEVRYNEEEARRCERLGTVYKSPPRIWEG